MHVRLYLLVALSLVVAGSLAAPALAGGGGSVEVTIRVEGKTRNIDGATPRTVVPAQGSVAAKGDAIVELATPNVLGALEAASFAGEFNYSLTVFSFGAFVDRIGRFGSGATTGWFFKVNGKAPDVGAADVILKKGDSVLWYWAKLDPVSFDGPDTLNLIRKRGCLVAQSIDPKGKAARAKKVVFKLDRRRQIASKSGRLCAKNWQTARVVKRGHVRSQVLSKR